MDRSLPAICQRSLMRCKEETPGSVPSCPEDMGSKEEMMGKRRPWIYIAGILVLTAIMMLTACRGNSGQEEPVTLTVWHVYGGQTDSPLNDMIEEFNETVGAREGIKLQVTVVSNTNNIHDAVLRAANNEPGTTGLPDMFISYPKTVLAMPDPEILVDYRDYFSDEELSAYIPAFLEEGEINGRLVVFPVAKSTEIMFIDKTLFDRFAADTGADLEQLNTWEGLFELSKEYYQWTDDKTPETAGDGKAFFVHDYHFNYFQVGVESLGEEFFQGNEISYGQAFSKVWKPYADAAIRGGVWLQEGYATEPLRIGETIVSVASSASVLYYEDIVTYSDNQSEPIEVIARPVPCFENGKRLVMQRGAGFCTVRSTPKREQAAAVFLKWLTEPEVNVRFVTSVGYMPVTDAAFEVLPDFIDNLENPKYKSLYEAFLETQASYEFYTAPQFAGYLELEQSFEKNVRSKLRAAYGSWLDGEENVEKLMTETLENVKESLPKQISE